MDIEENSIRNQKAIKASGILVEKQINEGV
jgi:hypothetical protein